jgi:hypothetical protein
MDVETTLTAKESGDNLIFSAIKCGQVFAYLAIVMNWRESNPLIHFQFPLGLNLIREILAETERLRKK